MIPHSKIVPEVVPWVRLDEVLRIRNGKDHKHLGDGKIPVWGSGGVMRFADQYFYSRPSVLIPRKGSLGNLFYTEEPFWTVDTLFYTEIDESLVLPKFVYRYLQTVDIASLNEAGGVPSLTQSTLNKIRIPLPSKDKQEEIVRILDTFTALEAELEAELEARKKQFEHYRNSLLTFPEQAGVRWVPLGDVCTLSIGEFVKKTKQDSGSEFAVYNGGTTPTGYYNKSNAPGQSVVISARGSIGFVNFLEKDFWAGNSCYVIRPISSDLDVKYLFHFLKSNESALYELRAVGTIPALNLKPVQGFMVPIISIDEQKSLASKLDKFQEFTTSLTAGLPAERVARKKQYEYYRDRLLTFKELLA